MSCAFDGRAQDIAEIEDCTKTSALDKRASPAHGPTENANPKRKAARANKDPRAVQFAQQRVAKTKSQYHKVVPVPDSLSAPENRNFPDPLSGPTGSGHLVAPLSISRVGTRSQLSPMCWAAPRLTEVLDPAERAAIHAYWRPKTALAAFRAANDALCDVKQYDL